MNSFPLLKKAVALLAALLTTLFAAGLIWSCLRLLLNSSKIAASFAGHTALIGGDYVLMNRVLAGLAIVGSMLLAHALARSALRIYCWKSLRA